MVKRLVNLRSTTRRFQSLTLRWRLFLLLVFVIVFGGGGIIVVIVITMVDIRSDR
jgi:hypothetical protein